MRRQMKLSLCGMTWAQHWASWSARHVKTPSVCSGQIRLHLQLQMPACPDLVVRSTLRVESGQNFLWIPSAFAGKPCGGHGPRWCSQVLASFQHLSGCDPNSLQTGDGGGLGAGGWGWGGRLLASLVLLIESSPIACGI